MPEVVHPSCRDLDRWSQAESLSARNCGSGRALPGPTGPVRKGTLWGQSLHRPAGSGAVHRSFHFESREEAGGSWHKPSQAQGWRGPARVHQVFQILGGCLQA